jgi:hypothetical protein
VALCHVTRIGDARDLHFYGVESFLEMRARRTEQEMAGQHSDQS